MTEAELALERAKKLAFLMTERFSMNPISAKLLNEAWRLAFPDEVAVARRMRAMVEALEKAQGMEAYWKTQCRGITDHCEVLQARIAELEPRTVKLPAERFCPAEYAGSQLWSETEVWNKAITACADELRASGIKVEAE
ncbi:hypothetical protein PQM78_002836 [Klebsiella pneumoniae]|nr:hypothetical protein [Klebsiella pneumoniae]EKL1408789.1 hypothetical protein [Klebsiella pneumoniae]EKW9147280.1 hypothetical protein [Klebsiella pneumoniae]HBZ4037567.1 hypothetical protein [Klebsiella pneumoniae]